MNIANQRFYDFYNGINFVTFGLIELNAAKKQVTVAICDLGKIIITDYYLIEDNNDDLYFEYGVDYEKIYIKDFEE